MAETMALRIEIDDGSRLVPVVNQRGEEIGAFTFRPTDIGIIQRYNSMAARFDDILAPLEALEGAQDGQTALDDPKYAGALAEAEGRLREAVDALLGAEGAAAAFFGKMNPFSPVEGEFYCARVLDAVGAFIGAQFEKETARVSEKALKYAKKGVRRR